jgi:hypothetical protein
MGKASRGVRLHIGFGSGLSPVIGERVRQAPDVLVSVDDQHGLKGRFR